MSRRAVATAAAVSSTDCSSLPRHQIIRLAAGIIRRQGSVMLETRLPKERDFAMLFHSDGKGNVTYRGLSLFFNGAANSYGGNISMFAPSPRSRNAVLAQRHVQAETAAGVVPPSRVCVRGIYAIMSDAHNGIRRKWIRKFLWKKTEG